MAQVQYRPENALRRARDFESSGDKDKALDHLYEIFVARRMGRQWQPAHEQMMIKFIELTVEYKEARKCKEGLHAYRSLAQQQAPLSLEKAVLYLVDLSMRKAAEARARTNSAAELDKVEDLEEEESPETLLMGAVTSEGSRDRAEREILVPWVRHMWDTYRNVLDVLRNTPLENLYHVVARKAMGFCKEYNRVTEFRKLTTLLRTHLVAIRRNLDQANKGLTTESVEKHVATRFVQLEHCAEMALWNEGFRTIEDIHEIMEGAGFTPKPQLMATYYFLLGRIFWVSENYLFHAYAWSRFVMQSGQNKVLSEEERRTLADGAVLAALAIPIYSSGAGGAGGALGGGGGTSLDVDVNERDKKSMLANLLRVPAAVGSSMALGGQPSRSALLAELAAKGILRMVHPEVAALYRSLEGDFDPLGLVGKAQSGLQWIAGQTGATLPPSIGIIGSSSAVAAHSLSQYAPKLERLTVFRTLEQLSSVYSTVTVAHFTSLIAPLKLSFQDVEKIAVRSVKERLLSVRLDHRAGVLRLGPRDGMDTAATRRQLSDLTVRLQSVLDGSGVGLSGEVSVGAPEAAVTFTVPRIRRDEVLAAARSMVDRTSTWINLRQKVLKKRQDDILRDRMNKQKLEVEKAEREAARYKEQDAKRLVEEEAARQSAKFKEIEAAQKKDEMMRMIEAAGRKWEDVEAAAAAHMDISTLHVQAMERARKEAEAEARRRTEQARRVDYLIRALREAERPKIEATLASLHAEQSAHVRTHNDAVLARAKKQFEDASAMKSAMSRMYHYTDSFEQKVLKARKEQHEAQKATKMEAERLIFYRAKRDRAIQRKAGEERRAAEEAKAKREQERLQMEADEQERQRQRESKRQQAEEESRARREEAQGPGDFRSMRAPAAGGDARPAAGGAAPAGTAEPYRPPARTAGGYVPPAMRGATPGDGTWRTAGAGGAAVPAAGVPQAAPFAPPAAGGGKYVLPSQRQAQPQPQQQAPPAAARSWGK